MIKSAIKLTILSTFIIFVLSLHLGSDRPLFNRLYGIISPLTTPFEMKVEKSAKQGYKSGKKMADRLFSNSLPRIDKIKKTDSAIEKMDILDDVSDLDKDELKNIIKP